jgi:hypothetical protein
MGPSYQTIFLPLVNPSVCLIDVWSAAGLGTFLDIFRLGRASALWRAHRGTKVKRKSMPIFNYCIIVRGSKFGTSVDTSSYPPLRLSEEFASLTSKNCCPHLSKGSW